MKEIHGLNNQPISQDNEGVLTVHIHFNTVRDMELFHKTMREAIEVWKEEITYAEVRMSEVITEEETKYTVNNKN